MACKYSYTIGDTMSFPTLQSLLEAKSPKLSAELDDILNQKADGADEVSHKGKTYKRSGPKNSVSQPGKWKEVPSKSLNDAQVEFVDGWAQAELHDYESLADAEAEFWDRVNGDEDRKLEAKKLKLTKPLVRD